jgi:Phage integrase, N-terminal SAM-like domain
MVNGEPEHHKEGVYYVRFGADGGKQQYALAGKDPYVALDKLEEKKRWLRDRERQVVPQTPVNSKPQTSKLSMDDAVEQYYKNLHSQGKDPKTIRAYKVAVEEFRKSCTKKFLSEIGRQDLIDFMGWLRKQPPKLRKGGTPRKPRRSGDPNRTYFNKVNNVVIFLSAHGINRLLKKSEYPKFAEKPVVYYDAEQVKALYAAAKNDEERFTLDYFLKSGVRDGEAAHAGYVSLHDICKSETLDGAAAGTAPIAAGADAETTLSQSVSATQDQPTATTPRRRGKRKASVAVQQKSKKDGLVPAPAGLFASVDYATHTDEELHNAMVTALAAYKQDADYRP